MVGTWLRLSYESLAYFGPGKMLQIQSLPGSSPLLYVRYVIPGDHPNRMHQQHCDCQTTNLSAGAKIYAGPHRPGALGE